MLGLRYASSQPTVLLGILMSKNYISPLESFHNTFFYFIKGVNALTWSSEEQMHWTGGFHAAWEIQYDVCLDGEVVLKCAGSFLTESERANIASLLCKVKSLSPDALLDSEDALNHPQWKELRRDARNLLDHLARPIAENITFLFHEMT